MRVGARDRRREEQAGRSPTLPAWRKAGGRVSWGLLLFLPVWLAILAGCRNGGAGKQPELRLGYFPNLTHAQALVGIARGEFKREFGSVVELTPKLFNSGPSAIEALLADEVDLAYVGPSPAINGFIRSDGQALNVIAGAASGGAVFVRRADVVLERKEDYAGKRFAAPQIGNSQDISLRTYLNELGYVTKEKGGNVEVLPLANPDILTLFLRKEIDGAWVPEPWGAILVNKGCGAILVDERDLWPDGKFATTLLVASKKILRERPEWVRRFLKVHLELTLWIQRNPEEAKQWINSQITQLTRKPIPQQILNEAFSRFEVTFDPMPGSLETYFQRARRLKYIKQGSIDGLYDARYLNEASRSESH